MRRVSSGRIALLFALLLITHFVRGGGADGAGPGLIARVEALEAEARTNRTTIAEHSKRIATLEKDLKATREACAAANSALTAQIKANRKEVYIDIGSIFVIAQLPRADWEFDQSHKHDVAAAQAGYLMGVRNGHRSATQSGSYRMMPKSLQAKCDRIRAE
jgi:hypothetical protein